MNEQENGSINTGTVIPVSFIQGDTVLTNDGKGVISHYSNGFWWVTFPVKDGKDDVKLPYQEDEITKLVTIPSLMKDFIPWSKKTFGLELRTEGLLKHIQKELNEIREKPTDTEEWIDVIILALDGAWRHGATPQQIETVLANKLQKCYQRKYQQNGSNEVCEHIRD